MNEINHAYHSAPHKCKFCDYSLPATKNYRTGELSYPELPDGVCDECRDYLMEHAVGGKEMNDLTNTLLDIARTAVDHDPTLLNRMPCSITDGPSHPDEDADYDEYLEQQNQDWWQQIDEDEEWIGSFSDNHDMDHWRDCSDFAEHQEEDR